MKYALISLLLFGCTKQLERPKHFNKEISKGKPIVRKKVKKVIEVPSGWKNKIDMSIPNHSAIDLIKKLSMQNQLVVNFEHELEDRNIFFTCKNITVLEAIKKICELSDLRIQIQGYEINIMHNDKYEHFHEITFLSNVRNATTSTNINSGAKGGLNIGSSTNLNSTHTSDLWKEIETNLNFILSGAKKKKLRVIKLNDNTQPNESSNSNNNSNGALRSNDSDSYNSSYNHNYNKAESNKKSTNHDKPKYTINKQAGILIVRGTQLQHRKVHEFLIHMHKRAASQVLIEAKVLSVALNHELKTGINWNSLNIYKSLKNKADIALSSEKPDSNAFKVLISENGNKEELINLLENFGEVSTVSNPTTTVLNNQYAVFKVAQNKIYFNLKQSYLSHKYGLDTNGVQQTTSTFSSEINTVPVGTILSVQPSIDFRNRTITLSIHPTISDVAKTLQDPAVTLMSKNKNITSEVPIISTQEMDSTIRVDDGDLVIIGGLIKKSSDRKKKGIPGVRKAPILGQTNNEEIYEETVIMLRAYIIDTPDNNLINSTKDYELFTLSA
ncbi:type II secretion system protein GspD [Candidatus Cytomitobacter primus]|uniref:Type II/III secretion system secretin-like domain-containing protein n=1 Tax=Candidatus Cytomitobacter primus TaxID=2066024 RepID=A0A5C0UEH5_9PROT|nr:hypothetical protein [Candidatus Cytomitobacter primus]QEK38496.1 hypothetical protein FZC34_01055 [Candidatus Cytomitobacter primus]